MAAALVLGALVLYAYLAASSNSLLFVWIVEKDRGRRYQAASGLARDLEHYLADEPVEACPPTASYRLRKFARRYRTSLQVAAAFVLMLIAGIMVATWLAIRAHVAERPGVG